MDIQFLGKLFLTEFFSLKNLILPKANQDVIGRSIGFDCYIHLYNTLHNKGITLGIT